MNIIWPVIMQMYMNIQINRRTSDITRHIAAILKPFRLLGRSSLKNAINLTKTKAYNIGHTIARTTGSINKLLSPPAKIAAPAIIKPS